MVSANVWPDFLKRLTMELIEKTPEIEKIEYYFLLIRFL